MEEVLPFRPGGATREREAITMTTTTGPEASSPAAAGDGQPPAFLAGRELLAEKLDELAAAFTALSGVLAHDPSDTLVTGMLDPTLLSEWPVADDEASRRGVALLQESASAGETYAQVRRDNNRLFFGPGQLIAPPYESVHLSKDRLLFERETMLVRAAYAEFGLEAPRLNRDPDDHIALELGFLAALCVRAMDALDAADDAELARLLSGIQRFLADHLLRWAPTCLTQALEGADTLFYRGVAELGLGTLAAAEGFFVRVP